MFTFTLSLGPGFYGSGASGSSETLTFDLNDYPYVHPPYVGTSAILGNWTMTGPGYGFVELRTKDIPDHPEIGSFWTNGYVQGPFTLPDGGLPFHFKITQSEGSVRKGTISFHEA